jgi:hypothetical protein
MCVDYPCDIVCRELKDNCVVVDRFKENKSVSNFETNILKENKTDCLVTTNSYLHIR